VLLIAAFAVYAIVVQRVRITRSFALTGRNARNFGITLLILLIPLMLAISGLLSLILPRAVLANPFAGRLVAIFIFGVITVLIAKSFRDPDASSAAPVAHHGNEGKS
jgi:hypothetical protein